MINLLIQYPGKVGASSGNYPFGTPRNITAPGDGTGTPWEEAWVKDIEGFKTALMALAGITPDGNPETAVASQLLEALQKIAPMLNVKAFGAVGDGVADDTVPVQAAIDNSLGSNGVYFPPGNYNCQKLTVPSDITLLGLGGELTLRTGTDDALIEISVGSSNVSLQNLKLNGNSANNIGTAITQGLITVGSSGASPSKYIFIDRCIILDTYANAIAVHDDASQVKILGCIIDDVALATVAGISVSPASGDTSDIQVMGCTILNTTGPGVGAFGNITASQVVNNHIDGTSQTGGSPLIRMREDANADLLIANNTLLNTVYRGIAAGGARIVIDGNQIEHFVNDGIRLEAVSATTSSPDCVISNNSIDGDVTGLMGITADDAPRVSIVGNTVRNLQDNAIQILNDGAIDTADQFTVSGNNLSGFDDDGIHVAGGSGIKNGSITGNVIVGVGVGTSVNGISIADALETVCTGNVCDECAVGIDELAAGIADFNLYVGNIVRGCTTGIDIPGPSSSVAASNLS